jgi:dienelactone hydrolase
MKRMVACGLAGAALLAAQTTPASLAEALAAPIHPPDAVNYQLRLYVRKLTRPLAVPRTAEEWTAESARLRRKVLEEVVFHGWPAEWIHSPPRFETAGELPTAGPYRLRKLRYEIVPGFWSVALLYEPAAVRGRLPAILSVNGHEPGGKAEEYLQKRCINQALQGMIVLHPEWIHTGELHHPENAHWFGAHLDLAGTNALGLFYLAMRRALDYLAARPDVDPARIGMTGLSGGGWQTIVLGALDERVAAAVPVAGYLPAVSFGGAEHAGDNEQTATDFSAVADYDVLTAMRAPRPTLLIYNAEDNCCFRAPRMKPDLFDAVRPFFGLFGKDEVFGWHENVDPGTHNYQLDNRLQAYRFFARHFGLPDVQAERPVHGWIKSAEELTVGLPPGQLTLPGLARKLAARISRTPLGPLEQERERLRAVLRYRGRPLDRAWVVANTNARGIETRSYRFDFTDGLTAAGVWVKAVEAPDHAPATLVLADGGRVAAAAAVSARVNRGEQALALELLFTGDAAPPKFGYPDHDRMLASLGERSLGIRVAHLLAVSRWLAGRTTGGRVRIEAAGMRAQVAALAGRALEPALFAELAVRDGIGSLGWLLEKPVLYGDAPELFCLDLYRNFDLDRLAALGGHP